MKIVLSVNENNASWLLFGNDKEVCHDFSLERNKDSVLENFLLFTKKYKINFDKVRGVGLLVEQASLTQVKILVTMINVIGWQNNIPVAAEFYFKTSELNALQKLIGKLERQKKFSAIKPEYQYEADITKTKKKANYTISK